MTAYTDTYIIDLALGHLAEAPVMNENDARPSVKFMRRHLDVVRDSLLRGTAWNFAVKRELINPSAVEPAFGFSFAYPLPSDWIRSLTPTEQGRHNGVTFPHRIEGRTLLCDQPGPLEYVYLSRPRDNSFFGADFVTALAAALAWRAANPVTGKAQFADWLFKVAGETLAAARLVNDTEGTTERPGEANPIVDMALGHMEAHGSLSEGDRRVATAYLNRHYRTGLSDLLRTYAWNFATKLGLLDRSSEVPAFRWDSIYALPGDFERVVNLTKDGSFEGESVPFQRMGNSLYAKGTAAKLPIVYVHNDLRPEDLPGDFATALAMGLAWRAVTEVKGKEQLVGAFGNAFPKLVEKAKEADSREGSIDRYVESNPIIDLALGHLMEPPAVEDGDQRAVVHLMRRHYARIRDELVRGHPWNFAIRRRSLTDPAPAPAFGWRYAYALPEDFLRSLPPTYQGQFESDTIPHQIEGNLIVTDQAAPLRLVYVGRVTDVAAMTPDFQSALGMTLAARFATSMPDKAPMAGMLTASAKDLVDRAKVLDGLEGSQARPESDSWINARFTGLQPDQRWYRSRDQE